MIEQTEAIVLTARRYSESSKIVTLYTRSIGLLSVIAKGAMRPRSRLAGVLQPLGFLEVTIFVKEGRSLQNLTAAETVERFPLLLKDLDRITAGLAIAELVRATIVEPEPNRLVFEAILRALRAINDPEIDPRLAELRFMVLLCELLGYAIQYDRCASCDEHVTPEEDRVWFSVEAGSPLCSAHRSESDRTAIAAETFQLLRLLSRARFSNLGGFRYAEGQLQDGLALVAAFLQYHVPGLRRLRVGEVAAGLGKIR